MKTDFIKDMTQHYLHGNAHTFEALTLFKVFFGPLIDPNIISIQCNLVELIIYRNTTTTAQHQYVLLNEISELNQSLAENDERVLDAYNTVYAEKLDIFNYLNEQSLEQRDPQLIKQQLFELIPYLPPVFFEKLQIFGTSRYLYQMHKTQLMQAYFAYEKEKELGSILRTTYRIIEQASEVVVKQEQALSKRLVKKIKHHYLQIEMLDPTDEAVKNLWDKIGKAIYEDDFSQNVQKILESDCEKAYATLDAKDKMIVSLALFDSRMFDFKEYQQNKEGTLKGCFALEDFLDPMIDSLMSEALLDWETLILV